MAKKPKPSESVPPPETILEVNPPQPSGAGGTTDAPPPGGGNGETPPPDALAEARRIDAGGDPLAREAPPTERPPDAGHAEPETDPLEALSHELDAPAPGYGAPLPGVVVLAGQEFELPAAYSDGGKVHEIRLRRDHQMGDNYHPAGTVVAVLITHPDAIPLYPVDAVKNELAAVVTLE